MNWTDSPTFNDLNNMTNEYDPRNSGEINEYYNQNEDLRTAFSMAPMHTKIIGFRCQTEGCENREAVYGTTFLPYCSDNINCLKKNMEYLLLENSELKGQLKILR